MRNDSNYLIQTFFLQIMFLAQLRTVVTLSLNARSSTNISQLQGILQSSWHNSAILNGMIFKDAPVHHHYLLEIPVLKCAKTSLFQMTKVNHKTFSHRYSEVYSILYHVFEIFIDKCSHLQAIHALNTTAQDAYFLLTVRFDAFHTVVVPDVHRMQESVSTLAVKIVQVIIEYR